MVVCVCVYVCVMYAVCLMPVSWHKDVPMLLFSVGPVRPAPIRHVRARQVCRRHGRPAVGHTHGTAVRHVVGRRDAEAEHSRPAGRRIHLPVGHRQVSRTLLVVSFSTVMLLGGHFRLRASC